MSYYFSRKLDISFDKAIERATNALKEQGFGVLMEIDVKTTLKKKLDVDFYNYKILGACNPHFAHRALLFEEKIGTMLPCNVIVRETKENLVEVAAVDPVASMQSIENPQLGKIATEVQKRLKAAIENL